MYTVHKHFTLYPYVVIMYNVLYCNLSKKHDCMLVSMETSIAFLAFPWPLVSMATLPPGDSESGYYQVSKLSANQQPAGKVYK